MTTHSKKLGIKSRLFGQARKLKKNHSFQKKQSFLSTFSSGISSLLSSTLPKRFVEMPEVFCSVSEKVRIGNFVKKFSASNCFFRHVQCKFESPADNFLAQRLKLIIKIQKTSRSNIFPQLFSRTLRVQFGQLSCKISAKIPETFRSMSGNVEQKIKIPEKTSFRTKSHGTQRMPLVNVAEVLPQKRRVVFGVGLKLTQKGGFQTMSAKSVRDLRSLF